MNPIGCPYCEYEENQIIISSDVHDRAFIRCNFCGARGPECHTEEIAISQWNEAAGRKKELAAYNKLSGGKTAIEYAILADQINHFADEVRKILSPPTPARGVVASLDAITRLAKLCGIILK